MMKVVTDKGTLVKGFSDYAGKVPLTQEEAEALAREKNAKAEKLGIETRYEVKEDA